jgi:hypothetical protein
MLSSYNRSVPLLDFVSKCNVEYSLMSLAFQSYDFERHLVKVIPETRHAH